MKTLSIAILLLLGQASAIQKRSALNLYDLNITEDKNDHETHAEKESREQEIAAAKKQEVADGPKMKAQEHQNRLDNE